MRRFSTLIAALSLVSLALPGCAPENTDPEYNDEEEVGEAADALVTSQIASYSTSPLEVPNGKKIVLSGGTLHATYRSGSTVMYTSSTDGVSWAAPVTVDATSSSNPTIAVSTDGTVMIAYVRSPVSGVGTIHIARRPAGGSFGTPFAATVSSDDDSSRTPSIVASGNMFYLTWARGLEAKYVSFPSSQASSITLVENVFTTTGDGVFQPAILVGPGSSGSIIRVALVENRPIAPNPPHAPSGGLNLIVRERGAAGAWSQIYFDSGTYYSTKALSSVSVDVNPTTGDSYVAVARTIDGAPWTALIRENTLIAGNSFGYHILYPTSAPLVSVAARTQGCQSRFRILTSTTPTGHGSASYRTGTWTSGSTPTWIDAAPVSLPGTSRAGTALLQSVALAGSSNSRFFYGAYEQQSGLSFQLRDAYDDAATPPPCE